MEVRGRRCQRTPRDPIGSAQAAVPLLSTKRGPGVPGRLAPCSEREQPGRPPEPGGPTGAEGHPRENAPQGELPASEPPAAPPPPPVRSSPASLVRPLVDFLTHKQNPVIAQGLTPSFPPSEQLTGRALAPNLAGPADMRDAGNAGPWGAAGGQHPCPLREGQSPRPQIPREGLFIPVVFRLSEGAERKG